MNRLAYLFMSARICDLNKSEEYFCYMQKLLISSGNANKPAYLKHYLRSFPSHVPDAVEQHLKDKNIPLSGLSLAQLHGLIMETWQNIVWRKEWQKFLSNTLQCFPRVFVKMLQKCQIGGVAPTTKDTSGMNHVVVRRNNSPNILVHLDFIQTKAISIKKGKRFKRKAYFKKRSEPADKEKCFICGKKGHQANKFPNKNKNPRLASMFSEDLDPSWWDLAWCTTTD